MGREHCRVSELARLCGVNPRTVDFYTNAGLPTPAGRSPGGHRFYDDAVAPPADARARGALQASLTGAASYALTLAQELMELLSRTPLGPL